MHQLPDNALVATTGPRAGDAFAELYRRYERPLLAYFARRVRDPEVAADLTAETFARAITHRRRFNARRGDASSWLFGIAGNVLGSSAKRGRVEDAARRRLEIDAATLTDTTLTAIDTLIAEDTVRTMLENLPEDQREAIAARILDGDSYDAASTTLGVSAAVARKRVSRGLATLRTTAGDDR